ncbi:MAG: hypothetical protein R3C20_14850 [Planctomycetaceae bacterium]
MSYRIPMQSMRLEVQKGQMLDFSAFGNRIRFRPADINTVPAN